MVKVRSKKKTGVGLIILVSLLMGACTGYKPARLLSAKSEEAKVDEVTQPIVIAPAEQAAPSIDPNTPAAPAAKTAPKVLKKTNTGVTISQTTSGLPKADIWPANEDRIGFTATEIKFCMHAAFVLGPLFNNRPEDEDVYFKEVNRLGGVFGRKLSIQFEDDAYVAAGTTAALDRCRNNNPFLYLGGVGFDQAPAGRSWAETNKQPYLYNVAVEANNLKYSWSPLASIQRNGGFIGQFAASRFPTKKYGVIYVDSDNWRAGAQRFENELRARGINIAASDKHPISNNNHPDFLSIITALQASNVTAVLTYINALALNRFIAQADGQSYRPILLSPDGFDLVPDTVGNGPLGDGVDHMRNFPGIYAGWISPAYEIGPPAEKARPSVPWYSEMEKMKAAYARHLPNKVPNDIDFMIWLYLKTLHQMVLDCTAECSRNVLAGMMLTGYKSSAVLDCPIDFSLGGGRLGGHNLNMYKSESVGPIGASKSYWRQIETCKPGF